MKVQMNFVFTFALLCSLLLSACSAVQVAQSGASQLVEVQTVGLGETLAGIQAAVQGQPGTFIMESDRLVLVAWARSNSWCFASFSKQGKPVIDLLSEMGWNAQAVDTFSFSDFVKSLEASGWKTITPDKLPPALLATLQSFTVTAVETAANSLPTVLILPVVITDGAPEVQTWQQ